MDISVSTKPQYDKAGGHNVISPSLAEGVRGWVDTTSAFQIKSAIAIKGSASSLRASRKTCVAIYKSIESVVIASERSERGKTRRSRSFFSNPQKDIDYHENPCGFSRNDE